MYRLITKADGSFQILDDEGENHGVFGDRNEALKAMDELSTKAKFPKFSPEPKKEKTPETKKVEPVKIKYPEMPSILPKTVKKSPVVKKSPIKAKRGRPKKR